MHRNRNKNKSNKALEIPKLLLNIVQQKVKNKYPVQKLKLCIKLPCFCQKQGMP